MIESGCSRLISRYCCRMGVTSSLVMASFYYDELTWAIICPHSSEEKIMYKLVLVRHGQSIWNLENRFTGWTDIDLTELWRTEASDAAKLLKESSYDFDIAYTSALNRAIQKLA